MNTVELEQPSPKDIERATKFYTRLRSRIMRWLENNTGADERVRSYLFLLPDMFALIVRLIRDPRVDTAIKVQLFAGLAYVISPIDLIPDFLAPLGLMDDTVVLAFILNRVLTMMGQTGETILWEHWEGEGDVLEQIQMVVQTAEEVLNKGILNPLRKRFGQK